MHAFFIDNIQPLHSGIVSVAMNSSGNKPRFYQFLVFAVHWSKYERICLSQCLIFRYAAILINYFNSFLASGDFCHLLITFATLVLIWNQTIWHPYIVPERCFYAPNFENVEGANCSWLVRASVRMYS